MESETEIFIDTENELMVAGGEGGMGGAMDKEGEGD